MGFLDALFGGDKGPTPKKIAANATLLEKRHGEPARRYQAMEQLLEWKTPEALDGLLVRYTVTAEKETSDEDEKAWLADKLAALGPELVAPAVERHLRKHPSVGWPLRVLNRVIDAGAAADIAARVLEGLDVHFDRQPERKVELIHALMDHAGREGIAERVAPFLDDTDDTVRIAAGELLARSGDEAHHDALVSAFVDSADRPRVSVELIKHMADQGLSVKGRKAEVEPILPEGYYLTREGSVKRLGQ
jgi:HEAT repeat protein